jgi:hypothetical protein
VHADSGRAQVESLFGQVGELVKRDGIGANFKSDDPRNYIAAWPQISKKLLMAKGFDPKKVHINTIYAGKWAVLSSTPRVTTLVLLSERYFDRAAEDPQEIVARTFDFETKLEPGSGWKIVVDSKGGEYADWKTEMLTWREYVSRGYKDKIDNVYAGGASDRGRRESESQSGQTRQLCEAQKKTCLAQCPPPAQGFKLDSSARNHCLFRCDDIKCN